MAGSIFVNCRCYFVIQFVPVLQSSIESNLTTKGGVITRKSHPKWLCKQFAMGMYWCVRVYVNVDM